MWSFKDQTPHAVMPIRTASVLSPKGPVNQQPQRESKLHSLHTSSLNLFWYSFLSAGSKHDSQAHSRLHGRYLWRQSGTICYDQRGSCSRNHIAAASRWLPASTLHLLAEKHGALFKHQLITVPLVQSSSDSPSASQVLPWQICSRCLFLSVSLIPVLEISLGPPSLGVKD